MQRRVPKKERRWKDLSASHQLAVTTLGWNEETWDDAERSLVASKDWASLDQDQKVAFRKLGYTREDFNDFNQTRPATESSSTVQTLDTTSTTETWPGQEQILVGAAIGQRMDAGNAKHANALKRAVNVRQALDYRHRLVRFRREAKEETQTHVDNMAIEAEHEFLLDARRRLEAKEEVFTKTATELGIMRQFAEIKSRAKVTAALAASQDEVRCKQAQQYESVMIIQRRYRKMQAQDYVAYLKSPDHQLQDKFRALAEKKPFKVQIVGANNLESATGGRVDPYLACFIPGKGISSCVTGAFTDECDPYWNMETEVKGYQRGDALECAIYNSYVPPLDGGDTKGSSEDAGDKEDDEVTSKGEVIARCRVIAHDERQGGKLELPLYGATLRQKHGCKLHVCILNASVDELDSEMAYVKQELERLQEEFEVQSRIEAKYLDLAGKRARREKAIMNGQATTSVPEALELRLQEASTIRKRMRHEEHGRCNECKEQGRGEDTKVWRCSGCRLLACQRHTQRCSVCKTAFCLDCIQRKGLLKRLGAVWRCKQCNTYFGKNGGKAPGKRFPGLAAAERP